MVLYKYLHKYGLRFLGDLKLRLTSPADVDDPFEMRPRVGSSEVTEEMIKRLLNDEDRMKVFVRALGWPNLDEGIAWCRENPQDFRRRLSKNMRENLQAYCDQAAEGVAKEYRMYCFSKSCDNILLWSHYGDNHRGIVVGFDSDNLKNALEARALEVNCRKDRTTFDAEQFLFPKLKYAEQLLTRKSLAWSYQEEVRFVVKFMAKMASPFLRFVRFTEPVVMIEVTGPAAVLMTISETTCRRQFAQSCRANDYEYSCS